MRSRLSDHRIVPACMSQSQVPILPASSAMRSRSSLSARAVCARLRSLMSRDTAIIPISSPAWSRTGAVASRTQIRPPAFREASHSPSHRSPSRRRRIIVADATGSASATSSSVMGRPMASEASNPKSRLACRFHRVMTPSTSAAITAACSTSSSIGSKEEDQAEAGTVDGASAAPRSISNHTVVGPPSSIPHRSATLSTRTRPQPPISRRAGEGRTKPAPSSITSTRTTASRTSTRRQTSAYGPRGPYLTAFVTSSLVRSLALSRAVASR